MYECGNYLCTISYSDSLGKFLNLLARYIPSPFGVYVRTPPDLPETDITSSIVSLLAMSFRFGIGDLIAFVQHHWGSGLYLLFPAALDIKNLRIYRSAQQDYLESLERLLFDADKFDFVHGRIWDHVPAPVQEDVIEILHQVYALLDDSFAIRKRYRLDRPQLLYTRQSLLAEGNLPRPIIVGRDGEADAVCSGTARRLQWVAWDKNKAHQMVKEVEMWTRQVEGLVESVWWPLFATSAQLLRLEEDGDARATGLLHGLALRRLLIYDARPSFQVQKMMEIDLDHFVIDSAIGNITTGQITGRDGTVLVEYKSYKSPEGDTPDADIVRGIRQLALLLSTKSSPNLMTLQCTAIFDDPTHTRFGLLLNVPQGLAPGPVTLAHEFMARHPPRLETRIALALQLAASMQYIHSVGWLHQCLSSENVLLFRCLHNFADLPRHTQVDLEYWRQPKLIGFDHTSPESGFWSSWTQDDGVRNLYRHPALCPQLDKPFSKRHDIYGNLPATPVLLLR